MNGRLKNYDISIQPDINKTLDDQGIITSQLQLNNQQILGIVHMCFALFGEQSDVYITIEYVEGFALLNLTDDHIQDSQYMVADLDYETMNRIKNTDQWNPIIIDYLDNRIHQNTEALPEDIRTMLNRPEIQTLMNQQQNLITKRYSCITKSVFPVQEVDKDFWVIQFKDIVFLQGMISVCQWFNLNPYDYITNLHQREEKVEFVV